MRFEDRRIELSDAAQPSTVSGDSALPAATLAEGVAYVTSEDGLEAIDTATGKVTWQAPTKNGATPGGFGSLRGAPTVVRADGGLMVYAALNRERSGQGTTPSKEVIEALAVDANSGKTVWTAEFESEPTSSDADDEGLGADGIVAPRVIAADADVVVVSAYETTYVVDRADSTVRWKKKGFRAVTMADGIVAGAEEVGYSEHQLNGYTADTGKRKWTASKKEDMTGASLAGPGLLAANGDDRLVIVDARTGNVRASVADSGEHYHPWRCLPDEQSLVLCHDEYANQTNAVVVFDTSTAKSVKKIWSLPDSSGRLVPAVTAFWHGAVYGETQNGPVILDGRTGKDRASPGVAPIGVDQYTGLTGSNGVPAVVPASG